MKEKPNSEPCRKDDFPGAACSCGKCYELPDEVAARIESEASRDYWERWESDDEA
jgi:hypothetical protein